MLGTLKVPVYVNISAIKYPCIVLPEGTCYGMAAWEAINPFKISRTRQFIKVWMNCHLPLFSDKRESKWCDGLVDHGREYWHIFR
jgi:hypothetical protein